MRINLLEVPEEGKSFMFNQNTKELNEVLQDLIGNTPYQVDMTILPMSSGAFNLNGSVKTSLKELCSRCAKDLELPFSESFQELLMPELDTPRNAKYSKPNHVSDMNNKGPSVFEYKGHHFEAGEYIHELVAISEPKVPYCSECAKAGPDKTFGYEDKGFEVKPISPFAATLKDLKLQ